MFGELDDVVESAEEGGCAAFISHYGFVPLVGRNVAGNDYVTSQELRLSAFGLDLHGVAI